MVAVAVSFLVAVVLVNRHGFMGRHEGIGSFLAYLHYTFARFLVADEVYYV